MSWFGNSKQDKENELNKRDWSTSHASEIKPRPMSAYGSIEIHHCLDGTYEVEKDGLGNVLSRKKI